MYEQNEPMIFRRILWIVLSCIAIVILLWVVIWFIFFRHHDTTSKAPLPSTSQSQQTPSSPGTSGGQKHAHPSRPGGDSSDGTSSNTPKPTPNTGAGGTTPTTSSELANTGAGDVITPFIVATVIGSGAYYVYQRRKLASEYNGH